MAGEVSRIEWKGYFPGVIGKITELHAVYYFENWGFDITFETQVGRELSEFMAGFNPATDGFWSVTMGGSFAGSVAIDGSLADTAGARLRWLIVDPTFHCHGLGADLVSHAVGFCRDVGHRRVFLWTFQGLHPARRLYERHGFVLTEEHEVEQWGQTLREQKFEAELVTP
jgi:GNAT superfamily N-acetyltransferase